MRLLAIACAILCSTCCPSLYLTVTKDPPAPREPLPPPAVDARPIPLPPHLGNRFIEHGSAITADPYTSYTDAPASHAEASDALRDLEDLELRYARPGTLARPLVQPKLSLELDATLRCLPHHPCDALDLDDQAIPVAGIRIAEITAGDRTFVRTVMECDIKSVPDGSAQRNDPCSVHERADYRVVLHRGVDGANKQKVKVRFSAEDPHLADTLLTFVHLSDIQIRDGNVRIGDRDLSRRLDWLIQSFEYDEDLQYYNRYLVEALFASINAEVAAYPDGSPDQPAFAIHTGDAIDAGVTTELREVHRLVDLLRIPFYDAIGNHDVLVFGNLMPTTDPRDDSACATASSIAGAEARWFRRHPKVLPNKLCVNARVRCPHCLPGDIELVAVASTPGASTGHKSAHDRFMAGFEHPQNTLLPQPNKPTKRLCGDLQAYAPTRNHGFDLDSQRRGYYAFAWEIQVPGETAPRNVIFAAIDTNDLATRDAGAGGQMQREQLEWLDDTLACAKPRDLAFVFGHHGIGDTLTTPAGELERILDKHHDNLVAYLYGHHHDHAICRDGRGSPCKLFWEVETGSVIEFPQEARRVKIKYAGKGLAFLELVTFHERLVNQGDARARAVELARRGAERDHCRTHRSARCSEDFRVYRDDGPDTHARLWFRLPGT